MGVQGETRSPSKTAVRNMDDGIGARKRVFIPGYSGVISRMQETIAGTFAQTSRDSHYLVYHGCKPTMEAATLPSPDTFYSRRPNPRIKTNAANRSNFQFGDERDWGFETLNETQFRVPTKIPPRHASILPGGPGGCTKHDLDQAYVTSLTKIGVAGVKRLELSIRAKIDQRTTGGPMALRKAFKFFDSDASGDIDPDEFYAAMHAFGLEFTEDQVLALFGYYDNDRDGALSYYEFIEKVLESGFGLDSGEKPEPVMVQLATIVDDKVPAEPKTVLRAEEIDLTSCREIFDRFDANKSGEIDIRELEQLTRALGLSMDRETINNSMFELDVNRNGSISFEEFWNWWQNAATNRGGGSFAAPRTGGTGSPNRRPGSQQSVRRPKSEQSVRRPVSRESNNALANLKSMLLEQNSTSSGRSSTLAGMWLGEGGRKNRKNSALSRPSRPVTRNSQRSVAGQDYCPPPMLNKPPKIHSLRHMQMNLPPRPHTAPTDPMAPMLSQYIRMPGTPGVPTGVSTGYVL